VAAPITLDEQIATIVARRDAHAACGLVDVMRRHRMTPAGILRRVQAVCPDVTEADWDALVSDSWRLVGARGDGGS
jgi:hypothetical protein